MILKQFEAFKNMRFGIRRLMLLMSVVGLVCATYVLARRIYFGDRIQAQNILGQVQHIHSIQIHGHDDVVEEVNRSSFSVDGYPDSIVVIGGLSHYEHERCFSISQIGKWRFRVYGCRHNGAYRADTGEPVESFYIGFNLTLGPNSPYQHLLPFEVHSLDDLVDHYVELIELFESWPREAKPGTVVLDDGTTQYYHVVDTTSQ